MAGLRAAMFMRIGVVAILLVARPVAAFQTPEPQAPAGEVVPTLSADEVRTRLSGIDSATDLPPEAKAEATTLYRQALDLLQQAEQWRQRTEEYRKGRLEAPELLTATRGRLQDLEAQFNAAQPPAATGLSLEQIGQELAHAEGQLNTWQSAATKLDEEARQRADRRTAIPELLTVATRRLETADRELAALATSTAVPQIQLARRTVLTAQRIAAQDEIALYQQELQYYDARSDVLAARRDEARSGMRLAEKQVTAWRSLSNEARSQEAQQQRQQVAQELSQTSPALRDIARRNGELAAEWETVGRAIAAAEEQVANLRTKSAELTTQFDTLKSYAELPDMADMLGPLMRNQRAELRSMSSYERELEQNRERFARTQLRLTEIDSELSALIRQDEAVLAELNSLSEDVEIQAALRAEVNGLLNSRREILNKLRRDYDALSADLIEVRVTLGSLNARVTQLNSFIAERVLWIPSTVPVGRIDVRSWQDIPGNLRLLGSAWLSDIGAHLLLYGLLILGIAASFVIRVLAARDLDSMAERVARATTDRYSWTLRAVLYTTVIAIPPALLLLLAGWRLDQLDLTNDQQAFALGRAAAVALWSGSAIVFWLLLVRHTCRPNGLAGSHFRWDVQASRGLWLHLAWFIPVALPLAVLCAAGQVLLAPAWTASCGRIAYLVVCILTVALNLRLLQPHRGAAAQYYRRRPGALVSRLRWPVWALGTGGPIALGIVSATGYHYTALALSMATLEMLILASLLAAIYGLATRGVFYSQRALALAEAQRRRAEQAAEGTESAATPDLTLDDTDLKIGTMGLQARQLLRTFTWLGTVIILWLSWGDLLPAFAFLEDVSLWSYTAEVYEEGGAAREDVSTRTVIEHITLANMLLAVIIMAFTIALARNIPGLLEIVFLRRLVDDAGVRFAIITLSRYIITVLGILAAFQAIGIGWSKVHWLIAAITVGLGFGLQEIFANFVSGLILLFERPLRIGDTVTVGDITGTVTRMRIRATTITNWDRKELVIPNREFVTGQFVNWSLSDQILRLVLRVGIAYGSNVRLARDTLLRLLKQDKRILTEPRPQVWFWEFGDSALNFEVRAFVKDVDDWILTRDALHFAIDDAFREHGIEIAFPQRDIHIRSIHQSLPLSGPGAPPVAGPPGADA